MDVKIAEDWKALLQDEFDKPYFETLTRFVKEEYAAKNENNAKEHDSTFF